VPLYRLTSKLAFPDPFLADPEGLLAVGGDLSVERLLLAYSNGIFPWFNKGEPILWWSPPERAIIKPGEAHFSRSLFKTLRKSSFTVRVDTAFADVIAGCAETKRPGQRGTWITDDMQEAYFALHRAGFAHSFETYLDGTLVGGLYGISIGGSFFGESMFSRVDDASKVAFLGLDTLLKSWNYDMIDCQLANANVLRYGAIMISRREFMQRLGDSVRKPTKVGVWDFPIDLGA
jgi:leucyl/phenylalanyl-tRNA--protein transferase